MTERIAPTSTHAAVIGAGTIGLAWAGLFAARGLQVRVHDLRPDLQDALRGAVQSAAQAIGVDAAQVSGFTGNRLQRALRPRSIVEALRR